jgi:hypothetical protein
MSNVQVLDPNEPGTALRIARAISGRMNRRQDQPDIALVTTPSQVTIAQESAPRREVRSPELRLIDLRYDEECRRALGPLLDDLLAQFEAAGWNRNKVAYEIMHLASQRLRTSG